MIKNRTMQPRINPWRRVAMTVGAMLLVLLVAASYRFVVSRGVFASVVDKTPGSCRPVNGVSDITALASDPRGVFVASRNDGLFLYNDGRLTRFAGTASDFHPIAMSVAGQRLLAVVAQADGGFAIAVFTAAPGKLAEIGRLSTDMLTDPADIVTIDGERFYLVNRHDSHTAFGRWLDDAFLIPRAEVLYFDGMKFVPVAKRLNSPAGVALSADLGHLYVSQGLPRNLVSFTRNEFIGSIDNAALLDLPAGPGKIAPAKDGSLIVAAVPKHGTGAVYRVRLAAGVPQSAELLYSSRSEEVSAAAATSGHLLVGTPHHLLDCRD